MKLNRTWQHILIMIAISAASLFVMYNSRMSAPPNAFAQFPMYALPFFSWYPFYHLGIYVAHGNVSDITPRPLCQWVMLFLFFAFTIASVYEGIYLANRGFFEFGASQIKVSSFLASVFLFLFAYSYYPVGNGMAKDTIVSWLGRHSFSIYLTHLLFLRFVGALLKMIPHIYEAQPIYVVLAVVLTITGCVIMIRITGFIFSSKSLRHCFGI